MTLHGRDVFSLINEAKRPVCRLLFVEYSDMPFTSGRAEIAVTILSAFAYALLFLSQQTGRGTPRIVLLCTDLSFLGLYPFVIK